MNQLLVSMLGWVAAASVIGFAISAVFAGWLRLSRSRFLIPYVLLAGVFLYTFFSLNAIDFPALLAKNWPWGILAGLLLSVFLILNVRSQPASRQTEGPALLFDLTWAGLIYGIIDALFLNVMPVVAIWAGTSQYAWASTFLGKIGVGALALLASLLVTLTYHVGYPEFRNKSVRLVLVGNSLITLAFLLTGSPWGSLLSHPIMHLAAVLQGAETTLQLPPHQSARMKVG